MRLRGAAVSHSPCASPDRFHTTGADAAISVPQASRRAFESPIYKMRVFMNATLNVSDEEQSAKRLTTIIYALYAGGLLTGG